MGEIVGAAIVSHVPPIVMPDADLGRALRARGHHVGRRTAPAPPRATRSPSTWTPSSCSTPTGSRRSSTSSASHARRSGLYTSEELPRGMRRCRTTSRAIPSWRSPSPQLAAGRDDTWVLASDDPYLPIHYPTINLLPFLQRDEAWVSVGICQTGTPPDFLLFGELLAQAIASIDRRVVLLASGGLSHRFWPLREFSQHETASLDNIRTPAARAADEQVLEALEPGRPRRGHRRAGPSTGRTRPEGFFAHYLMMVGRHRRADCTSPGSCSRRLRVGRRHRPGAPVVRRTVSRADRTPCDSPTSTDAASVVVTEQPAPTGPSTSSEPPTVISAATRCLRRPRQSCRAGRHRCVGRGGRLARRSTSPAWARRCRARRRASASRSTTARTPSRAGASCPPSRTCSARPTTACAARSTTSSCRPAGTRSTTRPRSSSCSAARARAPAWPMPGATWPASRAARTSPIAASSSGRRSSSSRSPRPTTRSDRSARSWSPPTSSPIATRSSSTGVVSGEIMQSANTSDLIFDVPALVVWLSRFMTFGPGDLVWTGTPGGVGEARSAAAVPASTATSSRPRSPASARCATESSVQR